MEPTVGVSLASSTEVMGNYWRGLNPQKKIKWAQGSIEDRNKRVVRSVAEENRVEKSKKEEEKDYGARNKEWRESQGREKQSKEQLKEMSTLRNLATELVCWLISGVNLD